MNDTVWILAYRGKSGRMYYFVRHEDMPGESRGVDVSTKFLCNAKTFKTFDEAMEHEKYGDAWFVKPISKKEIFEARLKGITLSPVTGNVGR